MLKIMSIPVIFAIGKSSYTEKPSSGNMLVEVSRCIMVIKLHAPSLHHVNNVLF